MFEVTGRGAENQHGHPLLGAIAGDVMKPLAHRTQATQIMVLVQELVDPWNFLRNGEIKVDLLQEWRRGFGPAVRFSHDASLNRRAPAVQPNR